MSCFNDLNEMELYNIEGGVIECVVKDGTTFIVKLYHQK